MQHLKPFHDYMKKRAVFYSLLFGAFITIAGAVIVLPALYYQQKASAATTLPVNITPVNIEHTEEKAKYGYPVRLTLSSVDVDLTIKDGEYDSVSNQWSISNDSAHFATISVMPNDKRGNTFIYGHYRPNVFYPLHKLNIGDVAQIQTDNGLAFEYRLRSVSETNPQDVTTLVNDSDRPTLTLQTCSGAWLQNRQLFVFDLVAVQPTS